MRLLRTILAAVLAVLFPIAAHAAVGDRLDRSRLTLTFADEFNGALSVSANGTSTKWKSQFFFGSQTGQDSRTLSGEAQVYVDPTFTAGLADYGTIGGRTGDATELRAFVIRPADTSDTRFAGKTVVSGILSAEKTFTQQYGYFEARMRLGTGVGNFPAFWLFNVPGTSYAELDVMESVTKENVGDGARILMTQHWRDSSDVHRAESRAVMLPAPNAFHTYGLMWTASTLAYYIDDVVVAEMPNNGIHELMYPIVNLALGGSWAGTVDTAALPQQLVVDFIHAYTVRP